MLSGSQLASSAFTIGTAAVLPFYTLMVLAPNSELVCFLHILENVEFFYALLKINVLKTELVIEPAILPCLGSNAQTGTKL